MTQRRHFTPVLAVLVLTGFVLLAGRTILQNASSLTLCFRIQKGVSEREVAELLGGPGFRWAVEPEDCLEGVRREVKVWTLGHYHFVVAFANGKVTGKDLYKSREGDKGS